MKIWKRIWLIFLLAVLALDSVFMLVLLLGWLLAPDKFTGRELAMFLVYGVTIGYILYLLRDTPKKAGK